MDTLFKLSLPSLQDLDTQLFGSKQPVAAGKVLPTMITPKYTPTVLKAIDTSRNLRMGSWVLSNPQIQKSFTAVKVKQEQAVLNKATEKAFNEGSKVSTEQYNELLGLETRRTADLANYLTRLSADVQVLQKGTTEGLVKEAQLMNVTEKYQQLLTTPPTSGDIDIKQLLIYGGIAVVGIIALSFLIKRN